MEDTAPIVSNRKYSEAERQYREARRIKQREERNVRKAAEKAAHLESLKKAALQWGK